MHKKLWSSFKMLDKEKNYKKRNISRAKRALCEIQRIFHNILRASFWTQALKQMHYGYFLRNLSYISAQRLKQISEQLHLAFVNLIIPNLQQDHFFPLILKTRLYARVSQLTQWMFSTLSLLECARNLNFVPNKKHVVS